MEPKVIVIIGPTCSGKTSLSLKIAERINCEIISADSRQVYKLLNIGTAKPTVAELNQIPHHLIDFLCPDEEYNASKFEKDSLKIISSLLSSNIIPIIVGGSGLYIKAIIDGIFDSVDTDEEFRQKIMQKKNLYGNQFIYDQLLKKDPKTASTLLPQNWKRIIRALEVLHLTDKPIWKHQEEHRREVNFNFVQFGLEWEREVLYQNIENRVDEMIGSGLVGEVKNILSKGFKRELNSLNTVGYKEIIDYLDENISFGQAVELIKRNTRRYAKRQLTWFRNDERINWYKISSKNNLDDISEKIINKFELL